MSLKKCQEQTAKLLRVGNRGQAYVCFDPAIEAAVNLYTRDFNSHDSGIILDAVRQEFPDYEPNRQRIYANWEASRQGNFPDNLLRILQECVQGVVLAFVEKMSLADRQATFVAPAESGKGEIALTFAEPSISKAMTYQRSKYGTLTPADFDEIESIARTKILEKVSGYDPALSSLDTWIDQQVKGVSSPFREKLFPRDARNKFYTLVEPAEKALRAELGRNPTDGEIAEKAGLSTKRVIEVRAQIVGRNYPEPLTPGGPNEENTSKLPEVEASTADFESKESIEAVRELLRVMEDNHSSILKLKVFAKMNFKEMTSVRIFPEKLQEIRDAILEASEELKLAANEMELDDSFFSWVDEQCGYSGDSMTATIPPNESDVKAAIKRCSSKNKIILHVAFYGDHTDGELLQLRKYPKDPGTVSNRYNEAEIAFKTAY